MSDFKIHKATRAGLKPLVGFYGKSGSGKTMSALLFARGLVGDKGRIIMIDSENGRGSIFSDVIPGGYEILDIGAPFSPDRYREAIEEADKVAVADAIVIDSFSHEWNGEGGVLDMQEAELQRMAGDDWKRRETCKMASWIKPKMIHKKLVGRILRCNAAMIVCLRGEEKTHMDKGQGGKTKVLTDEFSTPIADPRFIFEMLVNFETIEKDGEGGYVICKKTTHPAVRQLLPAPDQQISVEHGRMLAEWCAAPAKTPASASKSPSGAVSGPEQGKDTPGDRKALLLALRASTAKVHGWNEGDDPASWNGAKKKLAQWLWDEGLMDPDGENLSTLTDVRLKQILGKLPEKL